MGTMDTMVMVAQIFWLRTMCLRARELMCRESRIQVHPLWVRLLASHHVVSLILSREHGCITTYLRQARKPRLCITSGACRRTSVSTQDCLESTILLQAGTVRLHLVSLSPSTMHSQLSHICHLPNLEAQDGSDYESRNCEEAGWGRRGGRANPAPTGPRRTLFFGSPPGRGRSTAQERPPPPVWADITKPPDQVTPWKPTVAWQLFRCGIFTSRMNRPVFLWEPPKVMSG